MAGNKRVDIYARKLPIFIFNEHQEAYFYWHKAKHEGAIREPLDLFHFDAHDDMDRTVGFGRSLYGPGGRAGSAASLDHHSDFVRNELDLSNFILPAILTKLVRNVYCAFPDWKKIAPSRRRMNLASVFGEGRHIKYNLRSGKGYRRVSDPKVLKAFPDLTYFYYLRGRPADLPGNRKVILDIDLDYFACRDSIMNHMAYELEISRGQYEDRDRILNDPTLPFSRLLFEFFEQDDRHGVRISFRKTPEVSHLPEKQEIQMEIRSLLETLTVREIRPAVITISRSCHSGYCPKEYSEFIEGELVKGLGEAFRASVMAPDTMP